MMVNVYLKNFRKSWLIGVTPPLLVAGFVIVIASSWTSMSDIILARLEQMNQPIMIAILGDLGLEGLGLTYEAAMFMYAGGTMELMLLFVSIFIPARLISAEIDKNTLDVMLSFPIPRWRYLLEKYSVFLTYNLLFPILLVTTVIGSSVLLGEEFDFLLITSYAIGFWLLLFALGAMSLLCATIFLDSSRSLAAASAVLIGQYLLSSMGKLLGLESVQFATLFHYFRVPAIIDSGMLLPLSEVVIVVAVGVTALLSALLIFQKREFAI